MILILGKGYVAHKFKAHFGDRAELSDFRVEDYASLRDYLAEKKPEVLINCIGKTGRPNVDWCEDHQQETLFGNVEVPLMLVRACEELGIYMVHIGSGCVYEGDNGGEGFSEEDAPNFDGSFYSRTKAWSEAMLDEFPVLQLRLRMPLDGMPGDRNFITKITRYEKVISVPNSVSILKDFTEAAEALIEKRATGVFNMTNPGAMDHAAILDLYKEIVDPNFNYSVMSLEELEKLTKARRSNCILSMKKLESLGIHMRPVEQAMRETLEEYAKNLVN